MAGWADLRQGQQWEELGGRVGLIVELLEGMDQAHLRRRMLSRREAKAKTVYQALAPLQVAQFKPSAVLLPEGTAMKAHCKRLAGRSVLIGTTSFAFDNDGICTVTLRGRANAVADFDRLCKMNGVTRVDEGAPAPVLPEPPPPDTGLLDPVPVPAEPPPPSIPPLTVEPVSVEPVPEPEVLVEDPVGLNEELEAEVPDDLKSEKKTRRKAKNKGAE